MEAKDTVLKERLSYLYEEILIVYKIEVLYILAFDLISHGEAALRISPNFLIRWEIEI